VTIFEAFNSEERTQMNYIFNKFQIKKTEKGQDLAEYALLLGLIALIVILAVTLLGENLSSLFSRMASQVGTWF
jgi:pilus assembly protein Flp/PilA